MISNQVIINCIDEAKEISKAEMMVVDSLGRVITSTADFEDVSKEDMAAFFKSGAKTQENAGNLVIRVDGENEKSYALVISGADENYITGKLIAAQLSGLITAYKDKIDKNSFYQNLILDNLLLVDIYNKAKKLHIEAIQRRCVFVIELSVIKDPTALEMVKELYNTQRGDVVTTVDEDHIIVIKALKDNDRQEDLEDNARMLVDMFSSEAMINVRVAIGTIVDDIKGVSKSYKEALVALDVGRIFYAEKSVVSYVTLGIGRLIYQLPVNVCEMFIEEVFGGDLTEDIDDEVLTTVNKFLDNSLNVSETSRQLYIHRNTLVYRLDKLMKATGMDVRNFDDALSFRIAMMVLGYINYIKNNDR